MKRTRSPKTQPIIGREPVLDLGLLSEVSALQEALCRKVYLDGQTERQAARDLGLNAVLCSRLLARALDRLQLVADRRDAKMQR